KAHEETVRRKRDLAEGHFNLGVDRTALKKWPEAEAAFREAIKVRPDYAIGFCNLGMALRAQGRYAESLDALKRGDALGKQRGTGPPPPGRWVRGGGERARRGAARAEAVLKGTQKVANAGGPLTRAGQCAFQKRHAAAARLYAVAFAL